MQRLSGVLTSDTSYPDRSPGLPQTKASTKDPGSDPSRVTEVVIYLTDFILKYRCSCLLQLSSSAPICLGNKFEVRSGQKKKILLKEM